MFWNGIPQRQHHNSGSFLDLYHHHIVLCTVSGMFWLLNWSIVACTIQIWTDWIVGYHSWNTLCLLMQTCDAAVVFCVGWAVLHVCWGGVSSRCIHSYEVCVWWSDMWLRLWAVMESGCNSTSNKKLLLLGEWLWVRHLTGHHSLDPHDLLLHCARFVFFRLYFFFWSMCQLAVLRILPPRHGTPSSSWRSARHVCVVSTEDRRRAEIWLTLAT
jgi:hypothetical protein